MKKPKNYRLSQETIMRLKKLKNKIAFEEWNETEIVEYAIAELERKWRYDPSRKDQETIEENEYELYAKEEELNNRELIDPNITEREKKRGEII